MGVNLNTSNNQHVRSSDRIQYSKKSMACAIISPETVKKNRRKYNIKKMVNKVHHVINITGI